MSITISPAHEIKNTLGRAKAYLNKKEIVKGIMSVCEGVKLFIGSKIYGKDRMEIEYQIAELSDIIKNIPEIKDYLPDNFGYSKGKEKGFLQDLVGSIKKIVKEIESGGIKEDEEAKKMEEKKKRLLDMLQEYLLKKDQMGAASVIKRILSEYKDSPSIFVDIATKFYEAKDYNKALEFCKETLKRDKKNMDAFRIMVNCYRFMENYPAAEMCYKKAIEIFGEHGNIYFNLSRLYLEWDKKEEAKQAIKKALELDPHNNEYKNFAKSLLN